MKERQLLLPSRSSATGQHLWPVNTKSSLFLSYLWEGLAKLHHQLPFTSFFIFSFLTLDKTCRGDKKAGFQKNSTRTRQRRLLGSLQQDKGGHPPFSFICWGHSIVEEPSLLEILFWFGGWSFANTV